MLSACFDHLWPSFYLFVCLSEAASDWLTGINIYIAGYEEYLINWDHNVKIQCI